jgi:hypothetical protein
MRRIITILALAATMLLGTTATALAFIPPANPAGVFSATCGDIESIVNGHPGYRGQWRAIVEDPPPRTVGAWNATSDTFANSVGPITLCVDAP